MRARLNCLKFLLGVLAAIALAGCEREPELFVLTGETMGTTWSVKWHSAPGTDAEALREALEVELISINSSMSTWDSSSVISRFNHSASTDWFAVPEDMLAVLEIAQDVNQRSAGAFDITLAPLVKAWGFGEPGRTARPPDPQQLSALAAASGADLLALRHSPPALRKFDPDAEVDLSGVAKGYAVDVLFELMRGRGIENLLVEIGGEVRARGVNHLGLHWQVGIEAPESSRRSLQGIIGLADQAMASSGDYRNFFVRNGVRYSHTIDPLTAAPVTHNLAAVSIVAAQCALADAWATAMMALGPERGLQIAEQEGLAALFIIREGEQFNTVESSAFSKIMDAQQ